MKQLQFTELGNPRLVTVPDPVVSAGRLLLRTRISALSNGTERAQLMGLTYNAARRYPLTPGYQAVCEVVDVGDGVTRFAPGDLVYTGTFGTHAQLHTAGEDDLIVPLPADADHEALAFLAVAAVAWNDVGLTGLSAGETLLVYGAGPIGQFAVQAGRLRGADVTLASRGEERLRVAAGIGAVRTIATDTTDSAALREAGPFDVVAECSGADVLDGILGRGFGGPKLLVRRGGRLVLVAGRQEVRYDGNAAQGGRVSIFHCTHFLQRHLEEVLAHFLAGRLHSRPLLRDIVPAGRMAETYRILRDRPRDLFGTLFLWD